MTDDGSKYTYVYDAFGRLVTVKNRSTSTTIAEYIYDGLGQRIGWHSDVNASGSGPDASEPWSWFIHDDRWRIVATYRVSGGSGSGPASFRHASATTDSDPKERFIYHAAGLDGAGGSSYLDCMVVAQRDLNTAWTSAADNDPEAWHYPLANWRNDTVRVEDRAGGILVGYRYTAYGDRTTTLAADFNRDGFVDFFDYDDFVACFEESDCPEGTTADWNDDGFGDYLDYDTFVAAFYGEVDLRGKFRHLYAGYEADRTLDAMNGTTSAIHSTYHVRHRVYSTQLGRWMSEAPIGYGQSLRMPSLYEYAHASPLLFLDASGEEPEAATGFVAGLFCAGSICYNLCSGTISGGAWCWVGVGYQSRFGFGGYSWWGELMLDSPDGLPKMNCGTCAGNESSSSHNLASTVPASSSSCQSAGCASATRSVPGAVVAPAAASPCGNDDGITIFLPPIYGVECGVLISRSTDSKPCRDIEAICIFDAMNFIPKAIRERAKKIIERLKKSTGISCHLKAAGSLSLKRCMDANGKCVIHEASLCFNVGVECGYNLDIIRKRPRVPATR
jgi:RHS repeat-associated protein